MSIIPVESLTNNCCSQVSPPSVERYTPLLLSFLNNGPIAPTKIVSSSLGSIKTLPTLPEAGNPFACHVKPASSLL